MPELSSNTSTTAAHTMCCSTGWVSPCLPAARPAARPAAVCLWQVALFVENRNVRPKDYAEMSRVPRPGHADYTYQIKYGVRASSGGGRSSARETIGARGWCQSAARTGKGEGGIHSQPRFLCHSSLQVDVCEVSCCVILCTRCGCAGMCRCRACRCRRCRREVVAAGVRHGGTCQA
jgi:hypothetical protein